MLRGVTGSPPYMLDVLEVEEPDRSLGPQVEQDHRGRAGPLQAPEEHGQAGEV